MTAELLVRIVAVALAFVLERFPGVATWWADVPTGSKQLIVALAFVVIGAGAFGLSCAGIGGWFVCTVPGALGAVKLIIDAVIAGGGAYLLVRKK